MSTQAKKLRVTGFTLVELMIVVAIIGILTAIAYPSYAEHVKKARRAQAQTALLQGAQLLERYYSANGTYRSSGALAPVFPLTAGDGSHPAYNLSDSSPSQDASTFTLIATPVDANDRCGVLQINQAGELNATVGNFADQPTANAYCLRQ